MNKRQNHKSIKIVFLGSGSTIFAKNLMVDIWHCPELQDAHIVLYDIDAVRLSTSEIVGKKILSQIHEEKKNNARVEATQNIEDALRDAKYVITMFQVGGYKPSTVIDFEIPQKYGLRQTIGDTLGIGGIMRALRTAPVLVEYARLMERLCPKAFLLNYVNPMAINCAVLQRMTSIESIGLCHSVPNTLHELAHDLSMPPEDIQYTVAGINHMAFFLKLTHKGQDLYPRLHSFIQDAQSAPMRNNGEGSRPMDDSVRYEIMKHFGYFVTESSEHLSEYVPWFIKRGREDILETYGIPLNEYVKRCEEQIERWQTMQKELERSDTRLDLHPSVEYGASIINSLEGGGTQRVYANVKNNTIIPNLPRDAIVEVPCMVDACGFRPTHIGALPPQLAALMQTNVNVQSLCAEAIVTGNKEHVYHAAMLDPHTAAELDLSQIRAMVDELIAAHGDYIPCL